MRLDTFELHTVRDTPNLLVSLTESVTRVSGSAAAEHHNLDLALFDAAGDQDRTTPLVKSRLLLRVVATADYFTDRHDLMQNVPPTSTEIILDPWVGGLIPATVVPIAGYVVFVAALAYALARTVLPVIASLASATDLQHEKKTS